MILFRSSNHGILELGILSTPSPNLPCFTDDATGSEGLTDLPKVTETGAEVELEAHLLHPFPYPMLRVPFPLFALYTLPPYYYCAKT